MALAQKDWQKWGPRCPNHRVVLIKTPDPGIGICPVSGCHFSYDEEEFEKTQQLKLTAMGTYEMKGDWKLKHIEGPGDNNLP